MPFKPIRLLIAYDNDGNRCAPIVPRMKELLEDRAFLVDVHEIGSGEVDIEPYSGIVIGTPVTGLAVRSAGPTQKVIDFINGLEGLDEKKVATWCVFDVRPGDVFDKFKNILFEKGADVVAEGPYWRLRPEDGETALPAECMVRIRT